MEGTAHEGLSVPGSGQDAPEPGRLQRGRHRTLLRAIERTLEGYLLWATNDSLEDFMDHTTVYDRIVQVGLLEEDTADSLRALYRSNRTEHYYGGQVPTAQKEDAMATLAEAIHDFAVNQIREDGVCLC